MNHTTIKTSAFCPTAVDLHLASCYYPVLLELARNRQTLTYQQLVEVVQQRHPGDSKVQKMIPVRSGRILGVIYHFAERHGLPRISTLIVKTTGDSQHGGDCGIGVSSHLDCASEREQCFAFDWEGHVPMFSKFITETRSAIEMNKAPKFIFTSNQAENIYWAYFLANKSRLNLGARTAINALILELRKGIPASTVFQPYLQSA